MSRRFVALLLAMLPVTSGCGIMRFVPDVDGDDRPAYLQFPEEERPSALVRLEPDGKEDAADLLSSFHAPFTLPLFSSVAYQLGTAHMSTRADYVLDMSVRKDDGEGNWYTVVSALTLGALPIPMWHEYRAKVEVRDADGRSLGTFEERDEVTSILWLPALPLNVAFSTVDPIGLGRALGVDASRWEAEEQAMIKGLVREALLAAHERIRFRRPGPRPPHGETAVEKGK